MLSQKGNELRIRQNGCRDAEYEIKNLFLIHIDFLLSSPFTRKMEAPILFTRMRLNIQGRRGACPQAPESLSCVSSDLYERTRQPFACSEQSRSVRSITDRFS